MSGTRPAAAFGGGTVGAAAAFLAHLFDPVLALLYRETVSLSRELSIIRYRGLLEPCGE